MCLSSIYLQENVPPEVKAVLTSETEQNKISFPKRPILRSEKQLPSLITEATLLLMSKESYSRIIVEIDPGEVFGFVVVCDGKVIYKENCFSVEEVLGKAKEVSSINVGVKEIFIKIGNGVPVYRELAQALDETMPQNVVLEVVSEAETNLPLKDRSRRIRHISSATKIACRAGRILHRRTKC
jgi:hypothetical protein